MFKWVFFVNNKCISFIKNRPLENASLTESVNTVLSLERVNAFFLSFSSPKNVEKV